MSADADPREDLARVRVDLDHLALAVVRNPDRAAADCERERRMRDGEVRVWTSTTVDVLAADRGESRPRGRGIHERASVRLRALSKTWWGAAAPTGSAHRHPDLAVAGCNAGRVAADVNHLADVAARRVDANHGPVVVARDPERSFAEGEIQRRRAGRDAVPEEGRLRDAEVSRVEPQDDAAVARGRRTRRPNRAAADGQRSRDRAEVRYAGQPTGHLRHSSDVLSVAGDPHRAAAHLHVVDAAVGVPPR